MLGAHEKDHGRCRGLLENPNVIGRKVLLDIFPRAQHIPRMARPAHSAASGNADTSEEYGSHDWMFAGIAK